MGAPRYGKKSSRQEADSEDGRKKGNQKNPSGSRGGKFSPGGSGSAGANNRGRAGSRGADGCGSLCAGRGAGDTA
jgi:hypothetical protein